MIDILLIATLSVFDRIRGGWLTKWKTAKRPTTLIVMSLCLFFLLGDSDWRSLLCIIAGTFSGGTIGWGEPYGAYLKGINNNPNNLESWQPKILLDKPFVHLILRGFIWGALYFPILFFNKESFYILLAAYTLFFSAAVWIAKLIKGVHGWELSEFIRGALVGIFIVLLK